MRKDRSVLFSLAFTVLFVAAAGCGDEGQSQPVGLDRVGHIVVLMQENHSFDNYFGMLPYVQGGLYHAPSRVGGSCDSSDHQCVDGLTCTPSGDGINCTNFNFECDRITKVFSFHETNYCTSSPAHEWVAAHEEANLSDPNSPINLADGFVCANTDSGKVDPTTMGFYTQADLPYYYALAETYALSDRRWATSRSPAPFLISSTRTGCYGPSTSNRATR